jgi:hypothetical protein
MVGRQSHGHQTPFCCRCRKSVQWCLNLYMFHCCKPVLLSGSCMPLSTRANQASCDTPRHLACAALWLTIASLCCSLAAAAAHDSWMIHTCQPSPPATHQGIQQLPEAPLGTRNWIQCCPVRLIWGLACRCFCCCCCCRGCRHFRQLYTVGYPAAMQKHTAHPGC